MAQLMRSKEEVGRHVEQFGELFCLRFADRPLSAHNLRGDAAGTKNFQQVALTETVLFHKAAQTPWLRHAGIDLRRGPMRDVGEGAVVGIGNPALAPVG